MFISERRAAMPDYGEIDDCLMVNSAQTARREPRTLRLSVALCRLKNSAL
jgi:hypothetical protein